MLGREARVGGFFVGKGYFSDAHISIYSSTSKLRCSEFLTKAHTHTQADESQSMDLAENKDLEIKVIYHVLYILHMYAHRAYV